MPGRVVRGDGAKLVQRNVVPDTLGHLVEVLVSVFLGIVCPDPLGELRLGQLRVDLGRGPVGGLEAHRVVEAQLLRAGAADEPELDVGPHGQGDVLLPADLKTRGQRDGVLHGLRRAVARGREEGVSAVSYLDDARPGRRPGWLRIAPEQLEVDDGLGRRELDEFFEDRCPWSVMPVVYTCEHLICFHGVAPILSGRLGHLLIHVSMHRDRKESECFTLTSWFMSQTIVSGRVNVIAYAPGLWQRVS